MKNVLRLAIVDPTEASREALKASLLGLEYVWLEADCSRYEFFADVVAQTQPDIGIVALDANPEQALGLVSKMGETSPDCSILVVSSSVEGSLVLQAMRAGAKEFLTHPVRLDELDAALDRISNVRSGRGSSKSQSSSVIAVGGATGGVGSTSVAVNLGCCIAREEGLTPVLVDLDLCLGDADVLLDAIPDYTLADVTQNIARLDFTLLKRSLTRHASGLFLLPRPVQLEDARQIEPDDLQRVVGLLKATFTHVIIDLSKSYSRLDQTAMQASDEVLLVTQLDLPCLRNIVRLMISFGEMEGVLDKTKVIVNRLGLESGQISLKKAQDTIGREIMGKIPNDYRVMVESRNNGVPIIEQAPKAKITQAMVQLTESLVGLKREDGFSSDPSASSLGRLLSFWSGSGKSSRAEQAE